MKAGDVTTSPRKASCALASVRSAEGHGGGAACAEAAACAPHSARSEQRQGREGSAGGCDSRTRACRPVLSLTARPRPRLHPAPLPSASCLSLSQATSYHLLPGGPPAFGPTPVTGCHCKLTQTWAPFAPEAPHSTSVSVKDSLELARSHLLTWAPSPGSANLTGGGEQVGLLSHAQWTLRRRRIA